MARIQTLSKVAKILFWIGFWISPLAVLTFWMTNGHAFQPFHFAMYSLPLPALESLPESAIYLGFLVTLIPLAFLMLTLFFAAKLFSQYERGEIFTIAAARCIRNIAVVLLSFEVVRPLYDVLISFVLTYDTSKTQITVMFDMSDLTSIIVGLVLFVIGWVMLEATKIKQDHELTI